MTRTGAKAAFNHVMDNVLEQDNSSRLKNALTTIGIVKILDLVAMSPDRIDSLKAPGAASGDPQVDLIAGKKGLLVMLTGFVTYQHQQGNPIGPDDWFSITPDDFDAYCVSPAPLAFACGQTTEVDQFQEDIDFQNKLCAVILIQALF